MHDHVMRVIQLAGGDGKQMFGKGGGGLVWRYFTVSPAV